MRGELHQTLQGFNRKRPGPRTAAVSTAPAGSSKRCSIDVTAEDVFGDDSLPAGVKMDEVDFRG